MLCRRLHDQGLLRRTRLPGAASNSLKHRSNQADPQSTAFSRENYGSLGRAARRRELRGQIAVPLNAAPSMFYQIFPQGNQ
jgi:hypothetical protein